MLKTSISAGLTLGLAVVATSVPMAANACGGFFCTTIPINQAAEQIVFRQEAGSVTAMVRIQYTGNAEDFSWVIPVPDSPEISIGSDTTFNDLDFATQPLFNLSTEGNVCPQDDLVLVAAPTDAPQAEVADGGGVVIEEELSLGPFNFQVVSSDNPDDMSLWLAENNYLVTDRGEELIDPYVNAGMKFVAVKLRSGESSGSIQPIILKYASDRPMVPIRLTAIAAEDDMGVLIWVVNDQLGRAIPENYKHVIPNYTRLNWFAGSANAYGSYQTLITDAMDESGGQGFATDFAGSVNSDVTDFLTSPAGIESNLALLDGITNDAEYLTASLNNSTNVNAALARLQIILPLPTGFSTDLYFNSDQLKAVYSPDELQTARVEMGEFLVTRELEPLQNSVALVPEGSYMTRLYTTLSADEMTVDPTFNYNTSMPDQSRTREASIFASCENNVSNWKLTLGEGTGREGELVMDVSGQPLPFFGQPVPEPVNDQPATFERQRTSADAEPEIEFQANLTPLIISADGSVEGGVIEGGVENPVITPVVESSSSSNGFLGAAGPALIALFGALWLRRRTTKDVQLLKRD